MRWPFSVQRRDPVVPADADMLDVFVIMGARPFDKPRVWTDDLPDGRQAVRCFLSPFDAMIEAACLAKFDIESEVVAAREIDFRADMAASVRHPVFCLHLSWAAKDNWIFPRPDGRPSATAIEMPQRFFRRRIRLRPDTDMLARVDAIHERAGLFAWRETVRNVRNWSDARRRELAERAARIVLAECCNDSTEPHHVLFDPEFGQWHFVPFNGESLPCRYEAARYKRQGS